MKKTIFSLLVFVVVGAIGYFFMMSGPERSELIFAGNYQSFESMSGSINSDKVTVLDFYAPRCPSCRAAHKTILSEVDQLPANLQILNVDYDSNTALRQQYGVTSQHTFVLIDRKGNKLKSIQGLNHVSEIIDFVGDEILNPIVPETMTGEAMTRDVFTGESTTGETTTSANKEVTVTPSAGIYTDYEFGKKYITDSSKKVVLFFHASRCPSCKAAEADILKNKDIIDSNLIILKVDYDTETDLKQQYGVTTQTTYVVVNTDGTLNKKTVGLTSLQAIEDFVK